MTRGRIIWTSFHIPLMLIGLILLGIYIDSRLLKREVAPDPLARLQNYSVGGDYLETMNTWPFQTGINGDTNYNSAEMMNKRSMECNKRYDLTYYTHIAKHFENSQRIIVQFHYVGEKPSRKPLDYFVSFVPNTPDYKTMDEFKQDFPVCELGSDESPFMLTSEWLVFTTMDCSGGAKIEGEPAFSACDEIKKRIESLLLEK